MRHLDDRDVTARLTPQSAVALMRATLAESYRNQLTSLPRVTVDAGNTELTFTVGGRVAGACGFRVYGGWHREADQLTAVWGPDGGLQGIVTGSALGTLRTGALGGVAVDQLARRDSRTLGVIGSGVIAWGQVWAASAVRQFERVDVYSPRVRRREAFAERLRSQLALNARAVGNPEEVVAGHDVVIVSTNATSPVLEPGWISPGTHLTSTGPKVLGAAELGPEIADLAAVVVSDSPQQAQAGPGRWFSSREVGHLGGIVSGQLQGRRAESEVTLYCSTGLAGTEVILAESLLR